MAGQVQADELAQRHNTIIKDLTHGQPDLLLTLTHLQELRTDLAQAGESNPRTRELASMAALNQAAVQYYLADWVGAEESLKATTCLPSRAHALQRDFLESEIRLARRLDLSKAVSCNALADEEPSDAGLSVPSGSDLLLNPKSAGAIQTAREALLKQEAQENASSTVDTLSLDALLAEIKAVERSPEMTEVLSCQQMVREAPGSLTPSSQQLLAQGPSSSAAISIARGCVAMHGARPNTASLLFSEALERAEEMKNDAETSSGSVERIALGAEQADASSCAAYGLGLASMHRGDWRMAARFFAISVRQAPTKGLGQLPYVWIRLAECAIAEESSNSGGLSARLGVQDFPTSSQHCSEEDLLRFLGRDDTSGPELSLDAAAIFVEHGQAMLDRMGPEALIQGAATEMDEARRHLSICSAWIDANKR